MKPRPQQLKGLRQTTAGLRALQRLMGNAVMRPLDADGSMQSRWSDGRATKKVVGDFIKPNERLTSVERLEIYNRQYWFRLMDCFYDDYPGLRAGLGEARFRNLTMAYLEKHPSTHYTLRDLGWKLVPFIQRHPRFTAPHQKLALEMAQLEWAHIEAFDNAAFSTLAMESLSGKDPEHLRLNLQPHITLLKLSYAFDDYLITLRENSRLRGEASNAVEEGLVSAKPRSGKKPVDFSRIKSGGPIWLAVHRHQNMVYYKRLNLAQYRLLTALQKGRTLGRALASLPANSDLSQLQQWFADWAALGWFHSGKIPAKNI